MEQKCDACQEYQSDCICEAVAQFFKNAPQAPAAPVAVPRPIAMRSLQRLAAMLVAGFVAASATACGRQAPQVTTEHATPYSSTDYANPHCEVLQGPYGAEIMCPNGGYAFVRYREPGTMPAYLGAFNPYPATVAK